MKHTILIFILLFTTSLILAQSPLVDIEGDTKIVGKIDIISAVGDSSVFIGANAGIKDDGTTNRNTFVGTNSGRNNTTGYRNSFFGGNAGISNTSGGDNSFFGGNAGNSNTSGDDNSFFGRSAGFSNTSGDDNSFFGGNAGNSNTSGDDNSFFGGNAGNSNTSGDDNSFFGRSAGFSNTSGDDNSFFGGNAGFSNTSGDDNSFFGVSAGQSNTSGDDNSFFGRAAGISNTSGDDNSFFGVSAGSNHNNTRSTMLGYDAETTDSLDRAIAIGYKAEVSCHNCAVIGGTGEDAVKVGIGTSEPFALLHVKGVSAPGSVGLQILDNNIGISVSSTTVGISSTAPIAGSFNGDLNYTGMLNGPSDRKLKTLLKSEDQHMLDRINQIALHSYTYKTDQYKHLNLPSQQQYGVMAQELQKIFPDLVSEIEVPMTDEQGNVQEERFEYLGVNHVGMIPILIKGIQELAAENERLKVENESMKTESQSIREENKKIKDRLARLEALILERSE